MSSCTGSRGWSLRCIAAIRRIFSAYGQETLFRSEALRILATGLLNSSLVTLSQLKSAERSFRIFS